jgi:GNAT superfamily N-acetyltransferase
MAPPEVLIDPDTARWCENAELLHIRRQGEVCEELYPEQEVLIQSVRNGGITIRTVPAFGGKLNRAVGCGKEGELSDTEMKELESVFATVGLETEIHLSPFAQASVVDFLVSRGYVEWATLGTHWCTINSTMIAELEACSTGDTVAVRRAAPGETERFIEASAAGFQTNGRTPELLRALALIATRRKDTVLYFAYVQDEVAGTAAMANIETVEGSVAHLYLDSTLPGHRGQGVQLALIRARLLDAARQGLDVATSITRAGDGSARNAGRAGLRLAYTTPILTGPRG